MGKFGYCRTAYLIFCTVLFFNLSFEFAEAKVVKASQDQISTKADSESPSLTVYNQNRALIKEKRPFDLEKGINYIDWEKVASTIDIHSVILGSVNTEKPIEVKEQNYLTDLITASAILNNAIGKAIILRHYNNGVSEELSGILLGGWSGPERVIKVGDRYIINPEGQIEVTEIPSGLVSQPKLSFVVKALENGKKDLLLAYEANNINWQCDYNLLLNNEQSKLDLTGWVTLTNQSGLSFKNSNLKLIAGNVQANNRSRRMAGSVYSQANEGEQAFADAFADYHLYTFPNTIDINNNETKRFTLVERKAIPVIKKYIFDQHYYGRISPKAKAPVEVKLEFQNDEKNKQPLPAGEVRVYQADADNDMQLVGEDRITHVAVGEKITIKLGEAFDVIGERTRVNSEQTGEHHGKETFKVTFNNHLDKDIIVTDIEHAPDFALFSSKSPFSKVNSNTFQFDVHVPANGTTDVDYVLESKF